MDDDGTTIWLHGLDRRYSVEEVRFARAWAIEFAARSEAAQQKRRDGDVDSDSDSYDPVTGKCGDFDCSLRWDVLRTLLSDDAWGCGRAHLVDDTFKADIRDFCRNISCDVDDGACGIRPANFMKANMHRAMENGFVRMLRLCLINLPKKHESGVNGEYCNDVLGEGTDHYTALQLAATSDQFPTNVLQTLLQAGVRVDNATAMGDYGDTPLMLAISTASTTFPEKVDILIDYGADIDAFNHTFENSLHLAVYSENVRGLRTILAVRKERLDPSPPPCCPIAIYSTRLRKVGKGRCQEMLNQHDCCRETPLAIAAAHIRKGRFPRSSCWGTGISVHSTHTARREMINLLVQAGADANEGLPRRPYGWIQYNEYEDTVSIDTRNGSYMACTHVDLDTLVGFVDFDESVLGQPNLAEQKKFVKGAFERLTYLSTDSRRFECGEGLSGGDFDLYFSVHGDMTWLEVGSGYHDPSPRVTIFGYADPNAEYKIAVRIPRGPWPGGKDSSDTSFAVYPQYTLAHRAVRGTSTFSEDDASAAEYAEVRRLMFSTARQLCNPLLKCDRGLTAVEMLQNNMAGTKPSREDKQLLEDLQQDHNDMLTFIRCDAPLLFSAGSRCKRRRDTRTSRFHTLPDDACKIILGLL
jgi:hypothetical protein